MGELTIPSEYTKNEDFVVQEIMEVRKNNGKQSESQPEQIVILTKTVKSFASKLRAAMPLTI